MKSLASLLVCVTAAAGLLAALQLFQPEGVAELGLDLWNLPELSGKLDRANRQAEELETKHREALRRLDARTEVVRNLIDGQISLVEGIARFDSLNREATVGVLTEKEVCKQLLRWVAAEAQEYYPEGASEVLARFEEESRDLVNPAPRGSR